MPWTLDDYKAGKIEIDPGAKMSPQDAVNFYNRYRAKPERVEGDPGGLPGLSDTPTRVEGDPGGLPAAGPGNSVGANPGEAGPTMQMAFDGLRNAAGGGGGGMAGAIEQVSAPSSGNPMLGQRIYPQGARVLGQAFPRIY